MNFRSFYTQPLLGAFIVAMVLTVIGCSSSPSSPSSGNKSDSPASLSVLLGLDGLRQELQITPAQSGLLDALQADYKS
ncbi:MAG: hypothetical protein WCO97_11405, partial [bacterium]